jgi:hypothetical protein
MCQLFGGGVVIFANFNKLRINYKSKIENNSKSNVVPSNNRKSLTIQHGKFRENG